MRYQQYILSILWVGVIFICSLWPFGATQALGASIPSQDHPPYVLLLESDKNIYYPGEKAYFEVRLIYGKQPVTLDSMEVEAILPQRNEALRLSRGKNGSVSFSCIFGADQERPVVEVTVYKKNRHERTKALQEQKVNLLKDIGSLENFRWLLFWKRKEIEQKIDQLKVMVEDVESSIERIHAPLARASKSIVVLSAPALSKTHNDEEQIKETEVLSLEADPSSDTDEVLPSPVPGDDFYSEENKTNQKNRNFDKAERISSRESQSSKESKSVGTSPQAGPGLISAKGKDKIVPKEEMSSGVKNEGSPPVASYVPSFYSRVKDTIPPVTDADYTKNGIVTNENVKITLRAADNVSGAAKTFYRINGSNWREYDRPLSDFADGEHLLEYYSSDQSGNKEDPPKTLTVRIDRTAPALTVHYPSSTEDNTASINGTVSDDTMAVTMDGKQILLQDGAFSISYISLPKRKNVFIFEAFDHAGNKATRDIVVECLWDKIPPAITIKGVEEGKFYSKAVAPAVDVDDTQSTVTRLITLNGEPFSSGTPISENGKYTLSVQAVDGYENHASLSVSFDVDRTAPETKDDYKRADVWSGEDVKIALLAADGGSGVEAIYYRVGDGAFTAYQSPIEIQEEGIRRIEYYARDRLGNKESPMTITVKIDKTAPTIDLKAEELTVEATGILTPANLPVPAVKDNLDNAVQLNTEHLSKEGYPLGTTRVLYKAVDHAGNSSLSVTEVTIQDSTPPKVIFDSPQDNSYAAHTVNVRGEVKEIFLEHLFVNGKKVSVADGRFAETIPVVDDEFLVGVRAVDTSGNEDTVFRTVLSDILPPGTDHDYAHDGVWAKENARIVLSALDAGSGVKTTYYREGNEPFLEYRRPIDIRKEGKYKVEYYSIDQVGNEEGHRNISVWIDQTPPALKIASPKNGAYVGGKTIEVRGTVSDAFLSRVLVNGQPATVSDGNFVSTVLLEGEKVVLTVEAFDEAGHQSSDTVNILLDASLPVTTDDYVFDNVWVNQNARVHLTATDAGSGIQATHYRIYADGRIPPAFILYNPGSAIAIDQEGKWIVEYYSVDQVGDAETPHLISVLLDKTSPVTADNHGGHIDSTNKDVAIVLAATDAGSGVEAIYYRLDKASFAPVSGPVVVSQDGTHVLEYYALDKAGNEEAHKTLEIPIDKTLPQITVDSPANGSIIAENTVAIKGTVSGDTAALTLNGQSVPLVGSKFSVNNFKLALGENKIALQAEDGVGNQTTLQMIVTKVNRPPVMDPVSDIMVDEGQAVNFHPTGSDPDGDSITFSYSGWMAGPSYATTYDDAGVHTVTVTISDGTLTDSGDVTVTVNNVNRPPVLDPVADVSVNEGGVISFHPAGSDPDGDSVTFTYSGWMTTSGYTTTYDDAGKYIVTVTVSDGNLTDSQNVTVIVNNVNRTPVADAQNVSLNEDTPAAIVLTGSDPDQNSLNYVLVTAPAHGTVSGSAPWVTYTPHKDYNGSDAFIFKVNDGSIDSGAATVDLLVQPVNDAPVLAAIGNKNIEENAHLGFAVTASDAEGDVLTLTAAPVTNWMSFNGATFTADPGFGDSGNFTITFTASDGKLTDTEAVVLSVGDVNRPPQLAPIGDYTAEEGTSLEFVLSASDPDGDTLHFTASGLPAGSNFNANTRVFSWQPGYDQSGAYTNVHFEVNDGEFSDSEETTITVSNINRAPALNPMADITVNEGTTVVLNPAAVDSDGDTVTFTYAGWMSSSSRTTGYEDAGVYAVTVTASDGTLSDSHDVTVTVANVNRPPVLDFIFNLTVYEGETVALKPSASDPDGDVLVFTYSGWMTSSGHTVTRSDSGSHTVTVSVSDGKETDSQDVIVTVNVCGDSVLNGNEICDDGAQNGSPNKCNAQCTGTTIPVCGNNVLEASEGCDDGNKTSGDGCSVACKLESCGDSIVQTGLGEECEGSGTQNCTIDGYAGEKICGTNCKFGTCVTTESCGDGIKNSVEVCDEGTSNGTPNHCNARCTGTTAAVCGNSVQETGEACDDSNMTSGDGCSSSCVIENCGDGIVQTALGEICEGNMTESCLAGGYAGVRFCTSSCAYGVCTPAESCGDGIQNGPEICDEGVSNGAPNHCNSQCSGMTQPICGNGAQEAGEACDDSNMTSGDGCSSSCVIENCGDGIVQTALGETCEGNSIKSCVSGGYNGVQSCAANCTYDTCLVSESCGDGSVQTAAGEACDDGNKTSGDGCSVACKLEICGDKIVQTGEQCDDGNTAAGDGCNASCKSEYCGDEIIQTSSGEVCDLNSRSCTTSSGYPGSQDCNVQCTAFGACTSALFCGDGICTNPAETTVSCFSDCPSVCGNGIAEPSEECDDGNKTSGDGCSSACKIEFCGDGIVQASQGEECDDGNKTSADGCGNGCLREQLADTTAPSIPAGLTATVVSSSQANLSWTASTDNVGVTGYKIFRNNVETGTATTTNYSNMGLSPNINYSFTVSAYDAAGNESAESTSASATTQALPDTTASGAPVILYTDILSGPNAGGENNNGAYLSIFGKGFGATRGTSTVTINGVEVAVYKQWGAPSKVFDSHGIQVITVQPGPNVTSGPIVVTVSGEKSNSNHTFTVRSGKIFFTDYANGNDTNDGSINSPKKSVQNLWNDRAVYNPGDIIVMRGQTYTVAQAGDTFVKFRSNSMGTPENPTIIMGYPGEDVFIDMSVSGGADIFSTSTGSPPTGAGLILSNFRAHTGGSSAIRFNNVNYGRLVNTEIEGMYLLGNGTGMISSHSDFTHILGNKAHNSGQNKYYHGIYWSDQGHDNEIGWNHIYDIRGGRAMQVYDGGTTPFYNFAVHDNVIHDIDRDGINFGGPSTTGIKIYNNIIYRTGLGTSDECCGKGGNAGRSGIQMTAGLLDGSEIFNNTLFDNQGDEGQIRLAGKNMKVYNNIFYADTCFRNDSAGQTGCTDNNGQYFYSLESYLDTSTLTASNNVWFSVVQPPRQAVPSWDANPITSNPKFVDSTNPARNFHLQVGSPAIDAGTTVSVSRDFDGITRPQGSAYDLGAYEFVSTDSNSQSDISKASLAGPVILYTDILSGPNAGGENNNGAYLSIFGKGFGTTRGTSTVKINGVEVAAYKQWGVPSKVFDSHGIQVITVQPGVNVTSGSIIVTIGGTSSNSDHIFNVHAGDIYFVDGQTGNNSTGAANDITKPYLGVQYVSDLAAFGAGDTIVIRGGTYSVSGLGANFLRWDPLSGTVDSPMAVIGYPGETINIKKGSTGECRFSYYNGGGSYSTTANLNLDCNPNSTAFLSNAYVGNVRIVNNDFKGMHGSSGGSGLVTGAWHHTKILGNAVHEIGDTKLYHGIYLSCTDTSLAEDIEVGWNHVYDAFYGAACGVGSEDCSGRLIQLYNGLGPGFSNVSIHDNVLHDGSRHAISLGYTATGVKVYNNIIYRTGLGVDQESGIRINHSGVVGAEWYNNVGYDNANGLFAFDSGSSVTVRNNINVVLPGQIYESGAMNRNNITDSHNLFYGTGSPPSWADPATSVNADPLFVDPASPARNFHLQEGSPAIDSGVLTSFSKDFDGKIRPIGTAFDIGAFEDQ